jgi:GNAT superfamily N-acetyltransferase
MSVQIRPPRPGDGEGMARVWLTAGAYYADLDPAYFHVPSAEGLAASFEADIKATSQDGDKLRLVAERDNLVAGWLTAHVEHPYANAAHQQVRELGWIRLVIDALMVDQARWRQGTGSALLEAAESWGRERGAVVARLHTYPGSPVSVPFYEQHMGYKRRSILFQKPLLPGGEQGAQHVLHDAAVPVVLRLAWGVDPHDRAEFLAVG